MRKVIALLLGVTWLVIAAAGGRAEILIATAGPFTGQNIFRGEQIQHGAEVAIDYINRSGGVLGQRVELLIADDACDPDQAVAVAEKLVDDGVVFVAGHVCSHSSIPASKVYEAAGVLMISPASTNPKLTDEGGDNVFRVCGRDDEQGIVAGDYLADVWGDKEIAILHDGSTYGEGLAKETRARLHERKITETIYDAFEPGNRNYAPLIERLQTAGIDVAYVGGYSADTGLMVRQARDRGYEAQFVSGDALTNEEFWMMTGPAGEGTRGTFGPDPRDNPEASDVVEQFRERGFEPSGYTLHTYAAVTVWADASNRAGTLDLSAVVQTLRNETFETVLGKIGFDEKGDVTAPGYVWYAWKDGEYVRVKQP